MWQRPLLLTCNEPALFEEFLVVPSHTIPLGSKERDPDI
jgi:hypothetical protein